MVKKIIVINGKGGVGKDTLVNITRDFHEVMNISAITPIKNVAMALGWSEDLKDDKFICDNLKFHKTVLSKYEKKDEVATMEFQTSIEYFTREKKKKIGRKKQTRYKTQFIHVIDAKMYGEHKIRILGLNCPNCGAPIKDIDSKGCEYCSGSLIKPASGVEFVKRIWFLNNMKEY